MLILIFILSLLAIVHIIVFLSIGKEPVDTHVFMACGMVHMLLFLVMALPHMGAFNAMVDGANVPWHVIQPLSFMLIPVLSSALVLTLVSVLLDAHTGDYCREHPIVSKILIVCSLTTYLLFIYVAYYVFSQIL